MLWLGNGSRERLWDLPRSVAEVAQLSHPSSQDKTSIYSLPALLCGAKISPGSKNVKVVCFGDIVPTALQG